MYGFDKPVHERFLLMMKNYLVFDFGESFFRNRRVVDLVIDKMPVSISLGLWLTLVQYLVSIPLGIRKAVRDGSPFDVWSSSIITLGYAIPSFIFAIMLIVVFAGGSYFSWFPLRGLTSDNFEQLSFLQSTPCDYVQGFLFSVALPAQELQRRAEAAHDRGCGRPDQHGQEQRRDSSAHRAHCRPPASPAAAALPPGCAEG